MLKLDNTLLDELGLGALPEEQKRAMLQHIYETLELRVGTNLANQMSDQQLAEFEKFIDDGGDADQAQALQWLEANLPNYKQVVNEVFEALKEEIRQMAPQIAAASGVQVQTPPAMPAGGQAAPQQFGPASQQPAVPGYAAPAAPRPSAPAPDYYAAQPPATPPAPANPASVGYTQPAAAPAQQPAYQQQPYQMPQQPAAPVSQPAPMGGYQDPVQQQTTPTIPQQQQPASGQPQQDWQAPGQQTTDGNYQFPQQQPPAGPGGYPSQHPPIQ